ncbi:NAD-dependent epimerase/dehydratase family protein [Microcella daejeonensis]|uniref:NAD-dependent epimerase/dehydratase family protein n=1 Tax=Microcella daejeonensis TaxID=2994971 RepID=A0A9E8MKN3_9MICO|nr:NAD-dependent epimerase/dehydratase family protein [Microcella daejeonensis]WAB81330.1 NAD-dependent epimerase/dehydratase family protein [Microcella daejeonensis]
MARILILGGTAWLGRLIAASLVARGDDVTCLARGASGTVAPGATLMARDRREPGAYDEAGSTRWDAVIELAYDHDLVTGALEALAPRAEHWTIVSSVSVYAANDEPGADETAALVEPTDPSDYAHAKVAAEQATADRVGDRLLIARPGLIVGPGDGSDRFGYWVGRFALAGGGPVLVPGRAQQSAQAIDVRDLAAWVADAARSRVTGTVNAVGDPTPLDEVLALAAEVADSSARLVPADDDRLIEHRVAPWAGPRSLPLWLPAEYEGFARRSNEHYRAAGGRLRPLRDTLVDTLADERERGLDRPRRAGLTREDELELIAAFDQG